MNEIYKSITYITFSLILSLLSDKIESQFIDEFAKSFISLLTTLLAINIASSSLIAGKLKEINSKTGQSFVQTRKELKRSLKIQLLLIAMAFILLMFKSSGYFCELLGKDALNLISNTVTVSIFIYYLDTIKDLGQALFSLLDFDE